LIKRFLSNLGFLVVTIVLSLLVLELGFRAVSGVAVFKLTDWRTARVIESDASSPAQYNALVGWDNKSGIKNADFNTIDFGIRKNAANAPDDIRQNGILVIGDSFPAGAQVNDDETWPAQLENMIHQPVLNAAVGSWGIDQMELRIRQLFDATKPKIVILGGNDQAVLRLNFTSYGRPKPYYSLEDSKLVLHNVPVPLLEDDPGRPVEVTIKAALSYSYVLDRVIGKTAPAWWYNDANGYQRFYQGSVSNDEIGCALTKDIVQHSKDLGYRVLYVVQYGGQEIALLDKPPAFATTFEACAQKAGLQIVDDFAPLRVIAHEGSDALKQEFIMLNGDYSHMSAAGNRLVAELVAKALEQNPQSAGSR
jgi:lysophospholipase L1-like esterase